MGRAYRRRGEKEEGGRSTRIIFEVMKLKTSGSLVPRQEDFKNSNLMVKEYHLSKVDQLRKTMIARRRS